MVRLRLPMDLPVTIADELFNPFGEPDREELLGLSMKNDPEVAALNNAAKNAEVQLALARKRRLDIGVDLTASSDMPGSGTRSNLEQYDASATLEVRFIDLRISNNLAREASADIARYQQEIARRQNEIYVGAMEPLIKFQPLLKNMADTQGNINRRRNRRPGKPDKRTVCTGPCTRLVPGRPCHGWFAYPCRPCNRYCLSGATQSFQIVSRLI